MKITEALTKLGDLGIGPDELSRLCRSDRKNVVRWYAGYPPTGERLVCLLYLCWSKDIYPLNTSKPVAEIMALAGLIADGEATPEEIASGIGYVGTDKIGSLYRLILGKVSEENRMLQVKAYLVSKGIILNALDEKVARFAELLDKILEISEELLEAKNVHLRMALRRVGRNRVFDAANALNRLTSEEAWKHI